MDEGLGHNIKEKAHVNVDNFSTRTNKRYFFFFWEIFLIRFYTFFGFFMVFISFLYGTNLKC